MPVIFPDVAEFQTVLDDSYPRDVVSFRVAFGTGYQDNHFLANAAKAKALYKAGKIAGAVLYGVQIFAQGSAQEHFDYWRSLIGPKPPAWLIAIMLDEETWGGASYEQHGDHSQQVNALAKLCADYTGGKAIIYGNRGDLAELCPHRGAFPVIVASYGPPLVIDEVAHAIGQQYTNGQIAAPSGLPMASSPFGNCDHNVCPKYRDGHALRAYLRPGKSTPHPRPKPKPKHRRWFWFPGFWRAWRKAHPHRPIRNFKK